MRRLTNSPFGRVLVSIPENEERTRFVGYDTFRYKLAVFTIAGVFAGILLGTVYVVFVLFVPSGIAGRLTGRGRSVWNVARDLRSSPESAD